MAFELTAWRPFRELAPFREFDRMRREMDRLWDSLFERKMGREELERLPALDVSETKDEIVVKAEMPGMEAKDIDISLSGDILTIKGEKKQEKEQKDESHNLRQSRRLGKTVNRSKRIKNHEPPKGSTYSNIRN